MKTFPNARWFARALLWCSLINSPLAAASLVDAPAVDIATLAGGYHLTVMAQPSALALEDFISSTAGTVTLTTRTFAWGDVLSVLGTSVFIDGAPTQVLAGPGTVVFNVSASQIFSTSLRIMTTGPRGYGMAGYDVSFAPLVAPVPLPAGVWLLCSGIALLAAGGRRRSGRRMEIAA
jgi:hypothetical protein